MPALLHPMIEPADIVAHAYRVSLMLRFEFAYVPWPLDERSSFNASHADLEAEPEEAFR